MDCYHLPLKTLWDEMSACLKRSMREIIAESNGEQRMWEEQLLRSFLEVLREERPDGPSATSCRPGRWGNKHMASFMCSC